MLAVLYLEEARLNDRAVEYAEQTKGGFSLNGVLDYISSVIYNLVYNAFSWSRMESVS